MLELLQEIADAGDQVIGCALQVANPAVDRVLEQIEDTWFPGQRRLIVQAMRRVRIRGLKCNYKAVAKEVSSTEYFMDQSRGPAETLEFLDSAYNAAVTPANLPRYIEFLADLNARLSLIRSFERCTELAREVSASDVIGQLEDDLSNIHGYTGASLVGVGEINTQEAVALGGTPTPWVKLNHALGDTGGWPHGDLSLVMCAEGVGKSVLLLQAAYETAKSGGSVIFGTFEMTSQQMFSRLVRMHTGWGERPYSLQLAADYDEGVAELRTWDLRFYDPTSRPEMAYAVEPFIDTCLAHKATKPLDLVCVDYIQRLRLSRPTGKSWEDQYAVSLKLENMAKRTKSPVVIASQVSNSDGDTNAKGGRGPQELSVCTIEGRFDKDDNRQFKLRKVRHGIGSRVAMEMEWNKERRCYSWG